jgi:hypothetical protein
MAEQTLKFNMQQQSQDQWCWAAVSTSVSLFFDSQSGWKQCKIVDEALDVTVCCNSTFASSTNCNQQWYLNKALDIMGHLSKLEKGAQSFKLIAKEIEEGRPLGCLIKWDGGNGGGHFVVISGVNTDENSLDIDDSWNGPTKDLPYDVFKEKYRGDGLWEYSFFTKK